jgi:hypothetical protein
MNTVRFPSFADLNLDPELSEMLVKDGGKWGALKWLSQQKRKLPIREHRVNDNPDYREIKRRAVKQGKSILVRSNNRCEFLPGTEGRFDSVFVNDYGNNDEVIFRGLRKLPACPAPHLEDCWPKPEEMRFAEVRRLKDPYLIANLIEHPNLEGTFWVTITDSIGCKATAISDDLDFGEAEADSELRKTGKLEKIIEIAQIVAGIPGLDPRYTKQMEFGIDKNRVWLNQVKLLAPKEPRTKNLIDASWRKTLFRTYGVFDVEVDVVNYNDVRPDGKCAVIFKDFKKMALAGEYYKPGISVPVFQRAEGMLAHGDIPFFLYSAGVVIGDSFGSALNEMGGRVNLESIGKRARLRSDGTYLYATPLE